MSASQLSADANRNGRVDAGDLSVWTSSLGTATSSFAASTASSLTAGYVSELHRTPLSSEREPSFALHASVISLLSLDSASTILPQTSSPVERTAATIEENRARDEQFQHWLAPGHADYGRGAYEIIATPLVDRADNSPVELHLLANVFAEWEIADRRFDFR